MIGCAFVWGLAAGGGEAGVTRALAFAILREELDNALALLGRRHLAEVDAEAVVAADDLRPVRARRRTGATGPAGGDEVVA